MDPEKADELLKKYKTSKQANAVLKEGLLESREKCQSLEQQMKEKDATIRQQLEEIDHLQAKNARQSKQLGALNGQVEELQKQKETGGGLLQGFGLGGKQLQEQMQKAEEENRVLREELMCKIQENEELHMQIYEAKRIHDGEVANLRDSHEAEVTATKNSHELELKSLKDSREQMTHEIKQKNADLEAERAQTTRLREKIRDLTEKISQLEIGLKTAHASETSLEAMLEAERLQARQLNQELEAELKRWVHVDDAQQERWSSLDRDSQQSEDSLRDGVLMRGLHAGAGEACAHGRKAFQLWAQTFGRCRGQESQGSAQVRRKFVEITDLLATTLGGVEMVDLVQEITSPKKPKDEIGIDTSCGVAGDPKDQLPRKGFSSTLNFKSTASLVLRYHRKWVMYQCLLLLHHAGSGEYGQTQNEALCFVDGLWALHRRVRTLIARLRVCACMSPSVIQEHVLARLASGRKYADGDENDCDWHAMAQGGLAGSLGVARVSAAVQDVARSWEIVCQLLAKMKVVSEKLEVDKQLEADSVMHELLEGLRKLGSCLVDRVIPAINQVASGASVATRVKRTNSNAAHGSFDGNSLEESKQTQLLARQLTANRSHLAKEVHDQAEQLKKAAIDKASLTDELRALQDNHAVLKMNLQYLQEHGNTQERERSERGELAESNRTPMETAPSSAADLLMSSRNRALLDTLAVNFQDGASLRQHGYFVDVLSLSPNETTLASGRPNLESLAPWELAVRKVYEQHARNLQTQVGVADSKAMELYLNVQSNMDLLREQEDSKQKLKEELNSKDMAVLGLKEDIATTRRSYDTQLAMLTEHICTLSAQLSDKDGSLASLQTYRVLCGHCGMWNTMGKLMSKEAAGACNTCKEKVLSSS